MAEESLTNIKKSLGISEVEMPKGLTEKEQELWKALNEKRIDSYLKQNPSEL
jgi:hypothetical protein